MTRKIDRKMPGGDDTVMTAVEVADFLKVSVAAVRRWTRNGDLKGMKLGGSGDWRYFKRDVLDFLTPDQ